MSTIETNKAFFNSEEPFAKFVRTIFRSNKYSLSWNIALPFRVTKQGRIKSESRGRVIDDLRNSYGIDLTQDIELEDNAIKKEENKLRNSISMLKESLESNPKDTACSILLDKYKKRLYKLLNRNDTFNKYYLRKKKFKYAGLERLVASFLLVTGQVTYNNKYIFNIGKDAKFFKVNNYKSFDTREPFNQKIFDTTYYISASDAKFIKKAKWTLTQFLRETPNALKSSSIKFNKMYKDCLLTKINKMYPLVRDEDAVAILSSLYEYRILLTSNKKKKEFEEKSSRVTAFISSFKANNKNKMVTSFINVFPKAKLNKKDVSFLFDSCYEGLRDEFISKAVYDKDISELKEKNVTLSKDIDSLKEENSLLNKKVVGVVKDNKFLREKYRESAEEIVKLKQELALLNKQKH